MNFSFKSIYLVLQEFWLARPAFYFGIHFLLGAGFAYFPHWALILPLLLLWGPVMNRPIKIVHGILLIAASIAYAEYRYPDQKIPNHCQGKAYFSISCLKPYQSPFHRSCLSYQGTIRCFETKEQHFFNLPCTIYQECEVKADSDYLIMGELIQKGNRRYVLKPTTTPWEKVPHTFSFAHIRYQMKQALRAFLKKYTPDAKTLSFLSALATGDITERTLNFEFKQIGLLHILAISGFQFALMAAFFGFFLRQFLPYKASILILLAILSSYYFFLGPSPSVQRSYIAVLLFFLGSFMKLSSSGLNLLGMGLIIEILLDPLLVMNLGFELTFLCTAAILLFYQPSLKLFSILLPKRNYRDLLEMPLIDQHGYLLISWIRGALAINAAVHLVSLPALLFLFHKMPLLSLVYNLFFPFLTTLMLFLLILSLLLFPLFPFLHKLNVWLTSGALELTSNPPLALNFFIRVKTFSFTTLILSLMICLFLGILLQKTIDQKQI